MAVHVASSGLPRESRTARVLTAGRFKLGIRPKAHAAGGIPLGTLDRWKLSRMGFTLRRRGVAMATGPALRLPPRNSWFLTPSLARAFSATAATWTWGHAVSSKTGSSCRLVLRTPTGRTALLHLSNAGLSATIPGRGARGRVRHPGRSLAPRRCEVTTERDLEYDCCSAAITAVTTMVSKVKEFVNEQQQVLSRRPASSAGRRKVVRTAAADQRRVKACGSPCASFSIRREVDEVSHEALLGLMALQLEVVTRVVDAASQLERVRRRQRHDLVRGQATNCVRPRPRLTDVKRAVSIVRDAASAPRRGDRDLTRRS